MVQYLEIKDKLKNVLDEEDIKLNVPMKNYTSFKVGGPSDIFITPKTYTELIEAIQVCRDNKIPYFILGNGSNLLVKDGGIRGVVINLTNLNSISVEDNKIIVQSGVLLSRVANMALKNNLTGLEFASGIPGSIGGAIAMNAGAYNGEISSVIESVLIIDENNEIKKLSKEEMELGYRTSAVLKYGYIVLEAILKLEKGNYDSIKNRMDDLMRRRKDKQPLEYPSAGSTFKRPEGYFAAKLIEDANLKGTKVGGAEVSVKHSGFIINKGNATAKDILELINIVQKEVKNKFNVELNTEVRLVGEDK